MYMVQAEKAELLIVLRERELETHSLAARGVRPYCYSETAIAKASLDSSRRESGKEQAQRPAQHAVLYCSVYVVDLGGGLFLLGLCNTSTTVISSHYSPSRDARPDQLYAYTRFA